MTDRLRISALRCVAVLALAFAGLQGQFRAVCAPPISDFGAVCDWCDSNMLRRVEGVWEFPDDETRVLVRRSDSMPRRYDLVAVSSPDTRIRPGETIGYLQESAEADKFEMCVCRTRTGFEALDREAGRCLAILRDNDNTIVAKSRKLKFSLGSRWLLPAFWRMLRVTVSDPLESLPRGLVRVYPDGGARQPDYL